WGAIVTTGGSLHVDAYCDGTQWTVMGAHGIGGGITLKTNGTNNGSQSTLNLQQGTNVTLTDNGSGQVTITASNTGATAWSAITTGTNTQALHMGAGGSLDTAGGGTIAASTAVALASAPTQCAGVQFATGIAASGHANCATPSGTG